MLPLKHQVVGRYLHLVRHSEDQYFSVDDAAAIIGPELFRIWEIANIPTITKTNIKKKVADLLGVFYKLNKNQTQSDKKWFKNLYQDLAKDMHEVLDVKANDKFIDANSHKFTVPYGENERQFYLDQKNKFFLMTVAGVDKQWVQEDEEKRAKQLRTEAKRQRLGERKKKWEEEKAASSTATPAQIDAAIGQDESLPMCDAADDSCHVVVKDNGFDDDRGVDLQRYILTRSRKRKLESGEVDEPKKVFDLKVRDSYSMIRDCVYDFLIDFMSKGTASNHQAALAAKLFAKHILGVDWLLSDEFKVKKKEAEEKGVDLPEDLILYVLPSDTALDRMRIQYARAAQRSIAETILNLPKDVAVTQHGDSTTRSHTGKIFTSPLTVGDNLQLSLPVQKLNFETKNDVAMLYQCQYEMLGALVEQPARAIFDKIPFFMTDSAKEMNDFLAIIGKNLESQHSPHHVKCVLHTILGFTETEIKVVSALEQSIGPDKLYGESNCHDSANVSKSTIIAILKLISPQFQHKPYNLKKEFDALLLESEGDKKNYAFPLRSHRFGALEMAAAIVIHHWDKIVVLCEKVDNRNDLIIFCRTTMECVFVKVVILSFALIGLFLIEPYRELVSSSKHLDLCQSFPRLFSDLTNHKDVANGIINFSPDSIPSLSSSFQKVIEKKVYANQVVKSLQDTVDCLDDDELETLRNILGLFSHHCAKTLQRQRGEEYNFAADKDPNSSTAASGKKLNAVNNSISFADTQTTRIKKKNALLNDNLSYQISK